MKAPSPHPVWLGQRRRHLEFWCRHKRKCRVCRIVMTSPSGLAPLLRGAAECWQEMPVSLLISTASLWDWCLWRQWGEGMWICVSIDPASFNVFNHRTYCNGLFIMFFFSGVFVGWRYRDAWSIAGDFWQHYRPTGRDDVKTGDAGQSFDREWNLVFIEYSHFVQVQCNVLM